MAQQASTPSDIAQAQATPQSWWLKDPLQPSRNTRVYVAPDFTPASPMTSAKFYPKGSDKAVVLGSAETRGEEFSVSFWAKDKASHDKLMVLLRSGRTLLLQDVIEQQWYVRVVDAIARPRLRTIDTVTGLTGHTHQINVNMVEVARPTEAPIESTAPTGPTGVTPLYKIASIGSAPGSSIWGLAAPAQTADLDLMPAYAKWMRMDVDWSAIEATQGTMNWTSTDSHVSAAITRGLNVVLILTYSPAWARYSFGDAHTLPHPDFYLYWGAFINAAVSRYKPGAGLVPIGTKVVWEVWNEPNIPGFGSSALGGGSDPSQYAWVFNTAQAVARAVDPTAFVITGGTSPASTNAPAGSNLYVSSYNSGQPRSYAPVDWYRNLMLDVGGVLGASAPINGLFDGIGLHPYWSGEGPLENYGGSVGALNWNAFRLVRTIYTDAVQAGNAPDKCKVWGTECGGQTAPYYATGTAYVVGNVIHFTQGSPSVNGHSWNRGVRYKCNFAHTANSGNVPPNGGYWTPYGSTTGDTGWSSTTGNYVMEEDELAYYYAQAIDVWFGERLDADGYNIGDMTGPLFFYDCRDASGNATEKFGLLTYGGTPKGSGVFAVNGPLTTLIVHGQELDAR